MRVLLAIAHFFKAEPNSRHSSTDETRRERRAAGVRGVIEAWRGHLGGAKTLNVHQRAYQAVAGMEDELDIVVLVEGDNHLLDEEFCRAHRVRVIRVKTDDPRMIGFAARPLFADARNAYDMFVFSEDDLRPTDGALLSKIAGFSETFGWRRLSLPNRFEWNLAGPAIKTFIDGDLNPQVIARFVEPLPDEVVLRHKLPGREVLYRRATNPHSGFFAVSIEQLEHWIRQPHYNDRDCSFVSPLESAATLGIMKTFPIFKPFGRDSGWLEIEHLDNRFSTILRPAPKPEG